MIWESGEWLRIRWRDELDCIAMVVMFSTHLFTVIAPKLVEKVLDDLQREWGSCMAVGNVVDGSLFSQKYLFCAGCM